MYEDIGFYNDIDNITIYQFVYNLLKWVDILIFELQLSTTVC